MCNQINQDCVSLVSEKTAVFRLGEWGPSITVILNRLKQSHQKMGINETYKGIKVLFITTYK